MQLQALDFADSDELAGFRLQRLEVLNWGTFDRQVWVIAPDGHNALLTGDIGSGKSTLVDAITTLLVPHHRIVYNKAAGVEARERTLYSYIRGEYKSEKDDLTHAAKAVALRNDNSYTVLLAHYHNQGFAQNITLAQVFWLKDGKRNPERFFIISQTPLTIVDHFSNFGEDILDLKRRLRRTNHIDVLDNFKDYSSRFRHLFGIQHEQALELFYQTVSLKSVGNLTTFVRNHMLEKYDVDSRIDELRRNFDNLNRAHEAVLKAKDQIQQLTPLVANSRRYRTVNADIQTLSQCREALESYFANHRTELLITRIDALDMNIQKLSHRLATHKQDLARLRQQQDELKTSIEDQGGRRLQSLTLEIDTLTEQRKRRQHSAAEYQDYVTRLELSPVHEAEDFYRNLKQAQTLLEQLEQAIATQKRAEIDKAVELKEIRAQHQELDHELDSLRQRRSNIPLKNLEIRTEMLGVLGLDEQDLPFIGELLQVDETAKDWQGAIERLLHNFGLSLLVPDQLYEQVSHYVNRTHLHGRLVYYRIREPVRKSLIHTPNIHSLVRKLRIKPDSSFYSWLEQQLVRRFDYSCCESLEDFRRQPRAVTRNGQIKSGGQRHEKDDRGSIHDRSRYVLGWSNEDKIKALQSKLQNLEQQGRQLAAQLQALNKQEQALNTRRDAVRDLLRIQDYQEIHWQELAKRIQVLEQERRQIEQSSDRLQTLRTQLQQVQTSITENEQRYEILGKDLGREEGRREERRKELAETQALAEQLDSEQQQLCYPRLDEFRRQVLADTTLNLNNLDKAQRELRSFIQKKLENADGRLKRVSEKLIKQMQTYKTDYPAETTEVDVSLEALDEYKSMLQALESEDLPRHEARFKQLLNEGTIQSVALFQSQLERERQQIEEKIRAINTSLGEIEYNPGTYIVLMMDKTQDPDVRDFQQELRQCLAHSLDDSELYNETKFLQVKTIIDRFNGREGLVDLDRRWTRKVTDVRNWFNFSASERWQEDNREKEFYSDSSGKSGGQKEKLAYTILASALAYQFGLEWNAVRSRSFRFVVIDEAFGKGSDESTRYGLELFKKLNLQLLIVTPLQKIHIIEDYIASVHYVHNQDGRNSILRNLTVEEYQAEKQAYQQIVGA